MDYQQHLRFLRFVQACRLVCEECAVKEAGATLWLKPATFGGRSLLERSSGDDITTSGTTHSFQQAVPDAPKC